MHLRIALLVMVTAAGCPPAGPTLPGSTADPANAAAFWCAPGGQCFTAEADCAGHGACTRSDHAWCAIYGDEPRYVCAPARSTCLGLRDQLSARDKGECLEHQTPPLAPLPPPPPPPVATAEPAPAAAEPPAMPRVRDLVDLKMPEMKNPESEEGAAHEEDGIYVLTMKHPAWCADRGKLGGICFEDHAACERLTGAHCSSREAWACFGFHQRTSGAAVFACSVSYGSCSALATAVGQDPEATNVQPCVIFRGKQR